MTDGNPLHGQPWRGPPLGIPRRNGECDEDLGWGRESPSARGGTVALTGTPAWYKPGTVLCCLAPVPTATRAVGRAVGVRGPGARAPAVRAVSYTGVVAYKRVQRVSHTRLSILLPINRAKIFHLCLQLCTEQRARRRPAAGRRAARGGAAPP